MLIKGFDLGKKGKLYLGFIVVAAILAAAFYAVSVFASAPASTPVIVNANGALLGSTQIANASVAREVEV